MYRVWLERMERDGSLLTSGVEYGLSKLRYTSLKAEQMRAVESVLKGQDTFVSVPTGFGKSLIFSSPAFLRRIPNKVYHAK